MEATQENNSNHQGDWLEKTRGNLMFAATVIASMSFQVMVNPPGGVWQQDHKSPLVIAMVISSTVSFSASMSLILLIISGLRLRNRIIMGILVMLMLVAVLCITAAFLCVGLLRV